MEEERAEEVVEDVGDGASEVRRRWVVEFVSSTLYFAGRDVSEEEVAL